MLNTNDINLLLEALDAWEEKTGRDLLVVTMIGALLSRTPDEVEKVKQEQAREHEKIEEGKRLRQERVILTKAKLLQLRDKLEAGELIDDLFGQPGLEG